MTVSAAPDAVTVGERVTLTIDVTVPHGVEVRMPQQDLADLVGTTRESVDEQGRFRFDVEIRAPLFGRLVAYHGHLTPVSDTGPAAGEDAGDAASRSR